VTAYQEVPPRRIAAYAAAILVVVALLFRAVVQEVVEFDTTALLIFLVVGAVSIYALARFAIEDGISFAVIFWFWSLFSFAFAPAAILLTRHWTFGLERAAMAKANVLIVVYLAIFIVLYARMRRIARNKPLAVAAAADIPRGRLIVAVALLGLVTLALLVKSGFQPTLSPVLAAVPNGAARTSPMLMVADMLVRAATAFVFLFAFLRLRFLAKREPVDWILAILAACVALAMINPLSSSRFFIFTMYFGSFIVLFHRVRRYPYVILAALLGALLLSSAINFARIAVSGSPNLVRIAREDGALTLQTIFYSGHFDAYEQFLHSVDYVDDRGLEYGRQLAGATLFFVPRRFWPDKPVGTGAFVADKHLRAKYRVHYTNLSAPPIAEGYINFGVAGVLGAAVIFGLLFGWMDGRRRVYVETPPVLDIRTIRYSILYPVLVAYSLFYLRGDMLSGNAYLAGITAGYLLVETLVVKRRRPPDAAAASDTIPS
jgi:hypothetical protein